jgi:hypothetical protein
MAIEHVDHGSGGVYWIYPADDMLSPCFHTTRPILYCIYVMWGDQGNHKIVE